MITILGGELLCALGPEAQKIEALRTGKVNVGSMSVMVGNDKLTYPYYRIDETPCPCPASVVDGYLDRVVSSLLNKLNLAPHDLTNVGLFLGSSSIDYSLGRAIEQSVVNTSRASLQRKHVGGGNFAARLMERFALEGPSLTYNTACTSSANALMEAASLLTGGIIDYALVLGLELASATTLEGFIAMQLLSREKIRPFDQRRSGMVLGEAVGAVLLSRDDIQPSLWQYRGGASNCETFSVTGANPDGSGLAKVIYDALEDAGILPEKLTAVKAHGTAGELTDLVELRAMEQAFAALPPYFSLKPYIGHTLGGCGIAELLLTMECVDAGFIPPTINFETLDSGFDSGPTYKEMPVKTGYFMLNYFGFGGNNTSFIVEKVGQ
nr:hypothetical protein [Desulfobulbaceae bacterium]